MKIITEKGQMDLTEDFTVQIDNKSPISNDQASQTVPVTVPATPNNAKITGFPFRPDLAGVPMGGDAPCTLQDGSFRKTGQMHVVSASIKEGITINIGFDNAEAYAKWKSSYMQDLPGLPVVDLGTPAQAATHLAQVMASYGQYQDYAVFPVQVGSKEHENVVYTEYLNVLENVNGNYRLVSQARDVDVVYNNSVVSTHLPEGYGCTAFLYVGKVLEILFDNLGYTVRKNPFRDDPELARLVILNNTADAITTGKLYYADLMPSVSVEDFLQALYMRFGMVYQLENDTLTVRIDLLRDILENEPQINISDYKTALPLITFTEKKQVTLTSQVSFAEDIKADRYEDFRKGQGTLTSCKKNDNTFIPTSMFIELTTGNIYKWDSENSVYNMQSANFFKWDRQTKGVDAENVTSVDEAIQMKWDGDAPVPLYNAGYAHRHTYIRSTSESVKDETNTDTPLAFLLALPIITRNIKVAEGDIRNSVPCLAGTIMPYDAAGDRIQINGTDFSFTLLLAFSDGIFAKFWQKYDAILRHSANEVDTEISLPSHKLMNLNMLDPFLYEGQKMLPDTVSFSLPGGVKINAEVKMRTLNLVGSFNLKEEQGLVGPEESGGGGGGGGEVIPETSYAWARQGSNLQQLAQALIPAKISTYPQGEENDTYEYYTDEHGVFWYIWYEDLSGVVNGIDTSSYTNPETDTYLKENLPTGVGQTIRRTYQAKVFYSINGEKWEGYEHQQGFWSGCSDISDPYEEVVTYWVDFVSIEV